MPVANGRRVAVIAGCRTPFCKSGTTLKDVRAVDLARFVARELLERTNLDGADVNAVIFGQVVPSALVPNVAREVSLLPQFPKEIPAYSLNRACASSGQAVANAYDEIVLGDAEVVLAGGVESLSDIPILASRRLADILMEASKAKSFGARLRTLSRIRPRDLVPVSPAIAEPSTGETMGQSAEKMAKENHISRAAQDRWALRSHELAARGTDDGRITAEIVPWFGPGGRAGDGVVTQDNGVRRDTSLEQMAKLKPVFDRRYGSVTAANSSPLTDGASAVLVMSDSAARALGYTPLAYVRSYAVAAVDPGWQLLQAPIFAVPKALERAGIQWKELGVIEVHEAFAAQVLSNLQGWAAKGWEINEDIINVMGGSIAIGHPFGATGTRLVTTLANEMARRDVQFGLLSICAQGGMGLAMVWSAADGSGRGAHLGARRRRHRRRHFRLEERAGQQAFGRGEAGPARDVRRVGARRRRAGRRLLLVEARELHRGGRHRGVRPAHHRRGSRAALGRGPGNAGPGGALPQTDRRRDSRRVPRRRTRVRPRLRVPRGLRSPPDPARPPGSAARHSPGGGRLPAAPPVDWRPRGARHHPRGQGRRRQEGVPFGHRGRAGSSRHPQGRHHRRGATHGRRLAPASQAAGRVPRMAARRQPTGPGLGLPSRAEAGTRADARQLSRAPRRVGGGGAWAETRHGGGSEARGAAVRAARRH